MLMNHRSDGAAKRVLSVTNATLRHNTKISILLSNCVIHCSNASKNSEDHRYRSCLLINDLVSYFLRKIKCL